VDVEPLVICVRARCAPHRGGVEGFAWSFDRLQTIPRLCRVPDAPSLAAELALRRSTVQSTGAILNDSWLWPLAAFAVSGHLTNVATTIYLHRAVTHGGVTLHPLVSVPMRFWLWLTTGVVTREWVACHRKHHAHPDREGDPHSPVLAGVREILFKGWLYYRRATQDRETLEKYGTGCPDDWIERWVFSRFNSLGILLLLPIDIALLGWIGGAAVWGAQMIWMPALGGLVNGVGHAYGYRNYEVKDQSRNFFPLGLLVAGEELHNNHHGDPRSAKFSRRWFEFDVGWFYLGVLSSLGLAEIRHAAVSQGH
jgi:stearoyl-CoA desaturase (delta-9 desaturase)